MKNPPHLLALVLGLALVHTGCALPWKVNQAPGDHAFITYTAPPEGNTGLRLAVKDNIDVAGVVTTAGSELLARTGKPAAADAPCLRIARERGVTIVGKTNLSEFAVAPSGYNEYFGTPWNPQNRRLIPGGSSSGSAVAVATGRADVAFGTDTAGSVRVPAACCGIVGLKTSHSLVPLEGIHPIEPWHLDTVGPMGRDIAHTAMGMDLLQRGFAARYSAAQARFPSAARIRMGLVRLPGTDPRIDSAIDDALARAGFQVIPLGEDFVAAWEQAKRDGNTIAAAGSWFSNRQYRHMPLISGRTKTSILAGELAHGRRYEEAVARKPQWQAILRDTFQRVDFIALPTLQTTPPPVPINLKIGILEAIVLERQNTVPVNYAGNPALAIPVPIGNADVAFTSLQLIGPRLSEAELLNAGKLVEAAVH